MKKRCVGIHYGGDCLTAVMVTKNGAAFEMGTPLKLTVEGQGPGALEALLGQLSERLGTGLGKRPAVALTLGGRWYQTQFHHSEFDDERQLRQTLRFDIEEDLAEGAEEVALCFERAATGTSTVGGEAKEGGMDLLVHACERRALGEILERFEQSRWDALVVEPDVTAWGHYLSHQKQRGEGPLAAAACSGGMLYTLVLDEGSRPVVARSYRYSGDNDSAEVLGQELKRSLALLREGLAPQRLLVHTDGFAGGVLSDLGQATGLTCERLAESDASTAFAMGAALGYLGTGPVADFRGDGLEASTVVRERGRLWGAFSGALSLLLAAVLVVTWGYKRHYEQARLDAEVRVDEAYRKVFNKEATNVNVPRMMRNFLKTLKVQDKTAARQMMPGSASHTMMLVFDMLDTLGEDFALQIETLRVRSQVATLTGSVRGLVEKAQMQAAVRANPNLELEGWNIDRPGAGKSPRRNFTMSLRVVSERGAETKRSKSR